ncbi:MAG: 4-hydroxy-tetrahydrodipicolinate reductase, partial [Candidatus Eisenbacteria bacterium]|nr:4-hydroxy-tetrahydrodipicolinate reductase [Candidatus Eisenbacteria bacterium]
MSERRPVALLGATGRMGRAIQAVLAASDDLTLAFRADRSTGLQETGAELDAQLDPLVPGQVAGILDFSSDEGTRHAAASALRLGCPLVSGTTGLSEETFQEMRAASASVAVCWAPNFSVGVPLVRSALADAARSAPADWQLEIAEIHHSGKKDAPSGTALRFAQGWREVRGGRIVTGRQGAAGPRGADEIGVFAMRLGDVVGEHRILLGGRGETLEIVHRVQDRTAFAAGCVEALRRLLRKGPGWYCLLYTSDA